MKRILGLAVAAIVLFGTSNAFAGGYDTPILYTAKHLGMGGAAIGYVDDGSALFHNPAGMANTDTLTVTGDLSLLLGDIQASPESNELGTDIPSERTVAPFFLLGANYRIWDRLTIGLAIYPVASAGATYKYDYQAFAGGPLAAAENSTKLVFIEASPGLAVDLPGGFNIGLGYRITYVTLDRSYTRTPENGESFDYINFSMSGLNFLGFRAGVQWSGLNDMLQLGATYRSETVTKVTSDEGKALGQEYTDISTTFLLPHKIGVGGRVNLGPVSAAVDVEYGFNSKNVRSDLEGTDPSGNEVAVPNVFAWEDGITARAGVEYSIIPTLLAGRLGYIFDSKTSNETYPTPFGTPPGPTNTITAGVGLDLLGALGVNLAYAYRFGSATVTADDVSAEAREAQEGSCEFCGHPGEYDLQMHGIYLDVSYSF